MGYIPVQIAIFTWLLQTSIFFIGLSGMTATFTKMSSSFINALFPSTDGLEQRLGNWKRKAVIPIAIVMSVLEFKQPKINSIGVKIFFINT